jgi:hypothetical protein
VNRTFAVNVGSLADLTKSINRMQVLQVHHVVLTLAKSECDRDTTTILVNEQHTEA